MQLNYILEIGLALGGEDKAHYVDVVMNQSSVRNYSVKKLAEKGFDPETGIWWECPGYSVGVTLKDFAKFATRAKKDLGIDLLEEVPVLKKAFPAAGEYLFPDGLLIGFGDTHPSRIPDEVLAYAKPKTSPFFYAPNASWLVARSGLDPTNDVAFALNGSLGKHQHANGTSLELYARGYRLAPDAGIGWTLYSGDDYKEYYSQFPAHNTVMVDSRSTYQVMKSFHSFELVAHGENWATVRFREPATNAEQERTVRYVKDAEARTFIKATAPATEGLSRVKSPNYGVTRDSRTPCLVVRQRGEAWDRPFVAVVDPCDTVKGVEFFDDAIRVTRPSGKTDTISITSFSTANALKNDPGAPKGKDRVLMRWP